MNWEEIDDYHQRAKVFGGWLVKTFVNVSHYTEYNGMQDGWDWRVAMCFVPDPSHKWIVEEAG